jgi:hypothetical protein
MVEGVAQSVNQFLDLLDGLEQEKADDPAGLPSIRRAGQIRSRSQRNVTPPPSRLNALRWLWAAPGNS